jgi:catechol 2,3-dioxygenase-like lactoylglutathione lyase family enzyme
MIQRLGFVGVRTATAESFAATVALYRDVLQLEPFLEEPSAVWFRAADGSQIHVYGPADVDHEFFRAGPVVGLVVDDFEAARRAMVDAGVAFIGEPQRAGEAAWNHYVGPDGSVYEIMGRVAQPGA